MIVVVVVALHPKKRNKNKWVPGPSSLLNPFFLSWAAAAAVSHVHQPRKGRVPLPPKGTDGWACMQQWAMSNGACAYKCSIV